MFASIPTMLTCRLRTGDYRARSILSVSVMIEFSETPRDTRTCDAPSSCNDGEDEGGDEVGVWAAQGLARELFAELEPMQVLAAAHTFSKSIVKRNDSGSATTTFTHPSTHRQDGMQPYK
jgi:hypothetical protein